MSENNSFKILTNETEIELELGESVISHNNILAISKSDKKKIVGIKRSDNGKELHLRELEFKEEIKYIGFIEEYEYAPEIVRGVIVTVKNKIYTIDFSVNPNEEEPFLTARYFTTFSGVIHSSVSTGVSFAIRHDSKKFKTIVVEKNNIIIKTITRSEYEKYYKRERLVKALFKTNSLCFDFRS